MQPFFAYLLRCRDGSYYAGHTDELERRVAQHESGELPGYTCSRRPLELVWSEEFDTREEALETELKLKRWTRAKKEALIRGDWATLKELARGPDRSERVRRGFESVRSPFDSGPAGGRPYAQGERGEDPPESGSKTSREPARDSARPEPARDSARPEPARDSARPEPARDSARPEPARDSARPEPARDSARPEPARDSARPETARDSARPERSGRAAAAESKGELLRRG